MPRNRGSSQTHVGERAGAETPPPVRVGGTSPERIGTEELDSGVFRTLLPGGTEVWTERMDSMRSVAIGCWFRAGSAHEPARLAGAAHLLEHLVFKGTSRRSALQIASEIEDLGGSLDAYTSHEHTAFLARIPDDRTAVGIDVLCDLAFQPRLEAGDLSLEREVVLEEIARCDDTPDDLVFDLHAEFLYGGHPYGRPILGSRETVSAITADELQALHAGAYCPSNLVVAAAGRVDHEAFLDLVAQDLPDCRDTARQAVAAPDQPGTGLRRVARPSGRQTHIVAGAPGVAIGDPLRDAVILVGTALGGGMRSRLFQRIREELGLAYAVYSFHAFYLSAGHVGTYLGTRPETTEQALEALRAELRRLATEGLSQEEMAATRTQLKGQIVLALESPGSRMHRLASLGLSGEPYRSLDEIMARIDGVTADEAAAAAAMYDPDGLAVLELHPA
ncbi:MAG: insulinase family protein [Gemmatimonadota bacterium]|nr:insulinase family protein [Gemmatimonadota bacterium]